MSDDRATRSDLTWAFWLAAAPAVLVLYVLSIGPVAWIAEHAGVKDQVVPIARIVYAPLVLLYDHTSLKGPIEWYMSLWGVH